MKRIVVLCLGISICGFFKTKAQTGLERVIVEKYYVSSSVDDSISSVLTGGNLPKGSVTYRLFLDMLPNYKFYNLYGDNNHELRFETTTYFFNNEVKGNTTPSFPYLNLKNNTLMLDSWISVGSACKGYYGVLKTDDDGVNTVVNANGMLQNNDSAMGIPLTQQDGMVISKSDQTLATVTQLGLDNLPMFGFENATSNGQIFTTYSGFWGVLGGTTGYDPVKNMLLIAQLTTNGTFSYKINVQIIDTISGIEERYVVDNPIISSNERTLPSLSDTILPPTSTQSTMLENSETVKMFPNPVKDILTIDLSGLSSICKTNILIYDLLGNMLLTKNADTSIEHINMSAFVKGLYYVVLSNDKKVITKKIIKN